MLLPRLIAASAFFIMLAVNFFALNISSITLLILAGSVSLIVFLLNGKKGGTRQ